MLAKAPESAPRPWNPTIAFDERFEEAGLHHLTLTVVQTFHHQKGELGPPRPPRLPRPPKAPRSQTLDFDERLEESSLHPLVLTEVPEGWPTPPKAPHVPPRPLGARLLFLTGVSRSLAGSL